MIARGLSFDDYHEIPSDYCPGIQLLTYLSTNPCDEERNVSLTEACREHVPQELLERAASIELEPPEAESLLKGTKYEAVAHWINRLHCCTNNFFLDNDYEVLYSGMMPEWDSETVADLTTQWQQAELAEDKLSKFVDWLEEDMPGRFEELVNFILEKRGNG